MIYIYILAALVVGAVIGFLIAKVQSNSLVSKIDVLSSRLEEKERSFAERSAERQREFDLRIADKERSFAADLDRQEAHHREVVNAMQSRFDETVAKMKAELESLTSDLLKRRQSEFEQTNSQNMQKIVEPLNRTIAEMQKTVAENTLRHTEYGGKLAENLRAVLAHSDAARKSADRLADALSGSGKIQGEWGETILVEILESQGLTEGVHFHTQSTLRDAAGNVIKSADDKRMRPDVVLHLDRERDVIIDSKVSLSAYLEYTSAGSEEARAAALAAHVRSVENHVNELASKNYASYLADGKVGVGYVIMFVPNTNALYVATAHKRDLWRKAMERGVYIADEQTLYAALKIIDITWRQIAQAENHEKVFSLAGEMIDRVAAFMDKFNAVGRKLEEARNVYDDASKKLMDDGRSIPQTCRKLQKLGATGKKSIPDRN